MKEVWKYAVKPGRFTVEIPHGASFRAVHVQHGGPQLWFEVDPFSAKDSVSFQSVATGQRFDVTGLRFLGSFLLHDGGLVFHLYEGASPPQLHEGDKA